MAAGKRDPLPPGEFGKLGGANDSVRLAKDPAGYIRGKSEKHGMTFKASIAGSSSIFTCEADAAEKVLADSGVLFPPSRSHLRLIRKAAGDTLLLDDDVEEAMWWSKQIADVLYDGDDVEGVLRVRQLRIEHRELLSRRIAAHTQKWVSQSPLKSLYKSAKEAAWDAMLHLVLGDSLPPAEAARWQEFLTTQFRGCESLPLEGVPVAGRGLAAGVEARVNMLKLAEARLVAVEEGLLYRLGKVAHAGGRPPSKAAAVGVFLLHAIIPKALASVVTAVCQELTHAPQGVPLGTRLASAARDRQAGDRLDYKSESALSALVAETLRLHPPLCAVTRGVRPEGAEVAGYALPPVKSEKDAWICFAGVREANKDPARFGADAQRFRPSRWTEAEGEPPVQLTFGSGCRKCPGVGLADFFVKELLRSIFAAGVVPKVQCQHQPPCKFLPVERPQDPVSCSFVRP